MKDLETLTLEEFRASRIIKVGYLEYATGHKINISKNISFGKFIFTSIRSAEIFLYNEFVA